MLSGGSDPVYRAALAGPHTMISRVDVCDSTGAVLLPDISITAGSVRVSLQSRVTRTLTLTLDRSYFPITAGGAIDPTAALAPFGNRIKAYRGVQYGDGSQVLFQVFYGRIESSVLRRDGSCAVQGLDLAVEVSEADFEAPFPAISTNRVTTEVQRIITAALSTATFGTFDTFGGFAPALIWSQDRGKALDDLAAGVGAFWYTLADGSFVLRQVPWTASGKTSVATFSDGVGGTLTDWTVGVSRTGLKNSVVWVTERTDGTKPLYYVARNLVGTSPTYYLGPFGRKATVVVNQVPLTAAQSKTAAETRLRNLGTLTQPWSPVSIVPDASLELGDLITLVAESDPEQRYPTITAQQVIAGYTLPLMEGATMSLDLRGYAPAS